MGQDRLAMGRSTENGIFTLTDDLILMINLFENWLSELFPVLQTQKLVPKVISQLLDLSYHITQFHTVKENNPIGIDQRSYTT